MGQLFSRTELTPEEKMQREKKEKERFARITQNAVQKMPKRNYSLAQLIAENPSDAAALRAERSRAAHGYKAKEAGPSEKDEKATVNGELTEKTDATQPMDIPKRARRDSVDSADYRYCENHGWCKDHDHHFCIPPSPDRWSEHNVVDDYDDMVLEAHGYNTGR